MSWSTFEAFDNDNLTQSEHTSWTSIIHTYCEVFQKSICFCNIFNLGIYFSKKALLLWSCSKSKYFDQRMENSTDMLDIERY